MLIFRRGTYSLLLELHPYLLAVWTPGMAISVQDNAHIFSAVKRAQERLRVRRAFVPRHRRSSVAPPAGF